MTEGSTIREFAIHALKNAFRLAVALSWAYQWVYRCCAANS